MASKTHSGLIVVLLIILLLKIEGIALSDEKRLITHLLGNYTQVGVVGRPVYNISDTIVVRYGLALIQILDLDEKNQVLTTNCWGRYQWHDILLKWDPAEYGGVDLVRVPTEKIWTPDIVLYNYADTRLEERRDALAVVEFTGKVLWIPRAIYKSTCQINIIQFPFDKQRCKMKFGSWTYDGFKLDIEFYENNPQVDLTDYVESNEWIILESPAEKNVKRYPCCIEPYPDLTFSVVIQRQPAFYSYILILPCVLLSSLTLVLFWLPPESPAKMVLGMNIFLAFFVLLLLLADITPVASEAIPMIGMNIFVAFFLLLILLADVTPPAASELPMIGAYFCMNMGMITLSTFLSVIVINLYFRGDRRNKVPWLAKKQWHDILLKWKPEEYGGVDHVRVPTGEIWTPDIVLYNYADTRREEKRDALAVVRFDGTVLWIPPAIFKSTCKINIIHFPFDRQECNLKFGSWTYDGFKLDIEFYEDNPQVDLTDYVPSNEWTMIESPAKKNVKRYPCCVEPYPDLTFTIIIQRQPAFYRYILILPCVLLSALTSVLFWLPPESPAKMVLGMSIFVSFFVMLLLLAEEIPPTKIVPYIGMNIFVAFFLLLILLADVTPPAASELPQIGAYYVLNMGMITLSTFLSVIVINLYFRGDRRNRVPWWLKKIMLGFFATIFCMRRDTMLARGAAKQQPRMDGVKMDGKNKNHKNIKCPELKYNKFQMYDVFRDGVARNHNAESTSPDKSPVHLSHSLESDVKEIRRILRTVLGRIQDKDNVAKTAMEWRAVALVLDRFFFFVYITIIVTSLATIFPKPK